MYNVKYNSIATIYSKFVFSAFYYAKDVFYRSDVWWNAVVMRTFTHQDWLENFHMCKDTFMYICNKLSPTLRRTDTILRRALSVERRVTCNCGVWLPLQNITSLPTCLA